LALACVLGGEEGEHNPPSEEEEEGEEALGEASSLMGLPSAIDVVVVVVVVFVGVAGGMNPLSSSIKSEASAPSRSGKLKLGIAGVE